MQDKSHILFISNLGDSVDDDQLKSLFQKHDGFVEVRRVPGKKDLAFVEYESIDTAATAKNILCGFEINSGCHIQIEFAKS